MGIEGVSVGLYNPSMPSAERAARVARAQQLGLQHQGRGRPPTVAVTASGGKLLRLRNGDYVDSVTHIVITKDERKRLADPIIKKTKEINRRIKSGETAQPSYGTRALPAPKMPLPFQLTSS